MAAYLTRYYLDPGSKDVLRIYKNNRQELPEELARASKDSPEYTKLLNQLKSAIQYISRFEQGVTPIFQEEPLIDARTLQGEYIFAYYQAERVYMAENEKNIAQVELDDVYGIESRPGQDFVKYILNLKTIGAMAETSGKPERAAEIKDWFKKFDDVLKIIFDEKDAYLDFDIETFAFHIVVPGREPFAFDALSSGYAAVLDIVVDLMMRMEKKAGKHYDLEGVVLIDEIETHLHLDLQRKIMPILTNMFPNIQFIVTTHSPFILNSIKNAVIYDLENHTLVNNPEGLSNIPYDGIVEGYFDAPALSKELKKKYDRYRQLVKKETLTDDDYEEVAELEYYLDEIPDYLALGFMADYKQLKLELAQKE
ncbi:MAG: ATP-binding protein [Megasphaera sp.]|nr:ATP-binding protein [Megasphaera sp.]